MATRKPFLAGDLRVQRLWLVLGWMLVLLVVYLPPTPAPLELPIEQGDEFSHVVIREPSMRIQLRALESCLDLSC